MAKTNGGAWLAAWIAGLIILTAIEIYLATFFFGPSCQAPALVQLLVLIGIPGVYLPLMYLTLRSGPGPAR